MHQELYFAGWVIDGTGSPARRGMVVRVENGMIVSLEDSRESELRTAGLEYTDLSACTVVPGFVDAHVHLAWSGKTNPKLREEQLDQRFEKTGPLIGERIARSLSYGIMALRDGGDAAGHALRYARRNVPADYLPVHIKCAGKAWRAQGRYGKLIGRPPRDGLTLAESINARSAEADHVKIVNSGLNSLKVFGKETKPQFDMEEIIAAADIAHKRGQKVMVHANGRLPVQMSIEAGCDSIEHGFFMGADNMKRMADRQVFWVPTAFTMKAYSMHMPPGSIEAEISSKNLDHQLEQMALARKFGVPIAAGTDAGGVGVRHGRAFAEELKLSMEAGFGLEEAIRCATSEGARLLGLDDELGRLVKGMPANFVVVEGPPSGMPESLKKAKAVYVRGKRVASHELRVAG